MSNTSAIRVKKCICKNPPITVLYHTPIMVFEFRLSFMYKDSLVSCKM